MRIYIDEAGSFVPPPTPGSSFSLVLALVVPSGCEGGLFYEFLRLRDSWPLQAIEIKGSSLDEGQAAQVIDLLAQFDVVADFVAVDMATHPMGVADAFKARQAEAITTNITRDFHPDLILDLIEIEHSIGKMPNQLFIQAELTISLILRLVQVATLYFVQRKPIELGDIAWIIDRKGHTITEMEEIWTTVILPMGESYFINKPIKGLMGADYSAFARYEVDLATDSKMGRHIEWMRETHKKPDAARRENRVIDAVRLLTEQRSFQDSRRSLGLQLADILANVLRRALNDRLQLSGWKDFGKLVVNAREPGWIIQLGEGPPPGYSCPDRAGEVWRELKAQAKPMMYGNFRPSGEK